MTSVITIPMDRVGNRAPERDDPPRADRDAEGDEPVDASVVPVRDQCRTLEPAAAAETH